MKKTPQNQTKTMNKPIKSTAIPPRHRQPKPPTPVIVPPPAVIGTLLNNVLTRHVELLLFILLQVFLGLRSEEAYAVLSDPWKHFHGDTFVIVGRLGECRRIRITPAAWAWLSVVPGFMDRSRPHYLIVKRGKPISVHLMMAQVYQLLRAAGFDPDGRMPDELLRKVKVTTMFACGEPAAVVAQEIGHTNLATLHRHFDGSWSQAMGLEMYRIYPPNHPHPQIDEGL